ncbi:peptidylprolyl isomerase [Streptococcus rubneri]|uniref:Peptidyl-prolyl cis-trans isomerase n=1 Tax=Streptococcus rubneri TaxID=1234680 RepID=A0A4Z1DW72_9STRE|nr:peptidylprolyl isomerase [Streptococcus rubneri]MBK4773590.1 peptidylprolyl isomerase [Streptococcus rubneri]TGN92337.1 peptidylprolyl isomerase [Streptococcus rubneri]
MKKIIALLLFSGLALTACTTNKTNSSSSSSSKEQTEQTSTSSSNQKDQKKIEEEQKKLEQLRKDFNDAMTNENAVFPQLSNEVAEDEAVVKITTNKGDITVKLFPKYAPLAVENFLTHAKEGYYDGLLFHRVINNFMIQTGDPKGDGTGGESIWKGKDTSKDPGSGFENEYSPYLYNLRGALAMANSGPNTNGSQFYINQNKADISSKLPTDRFPAKIIEAYKNGGNPTLDGGNYTVFGQVIDGMDVVDKIAEVETDDKDKPKEDVKIEKMEVVKDYDFKK